MDVLLKQFIEKAWAWGPPFVAVLLWMWAGYKQKWRWDREIVREKDLAAMETKRADKAEDRERYWQDLFIKQTNAIEILNETVRELQTQLKLLSGAK